MIGKLTGVLDWGDAAIGDPAADFVGILLAYGAEFTWRVVEAYGRQGARADAGLFQRVRRLAPVAPFHAIRFAAETPDDEAAPDLAASVDALRTGPILRR